MRLEFESNVSSVPFAENEPAENAAETAFAQNSELLREGIKAAQAGNRGEARHLLLRVTETEPQNENAWLWLASISEYPEELLIFLNNVLNVNSENARAKEWMKQTKSLLAKTFVQRGIDASKEGRNDFAKQCFYQAAAHDDANEMAWLWLASVSDKAEEKTVHLNKALLINPANEDAQTALKAVQQELAKTLLQKAVFAAEAGDKQTAGELLKEIFHKSTEMEEAWTLKAELADDSSEKIRYYEKVLELNSANENAADQLKNIHHEQTLTLLQNAKSAAFSGNAQAAHEMLEEVLEKSPEMEEAWLLKSHLALGFAEKMRCFEKVLELNPNNETANSGLNTLRAFMPKVETEKDEYSQMEEEFGFEESVHEESVHEETQPAKDEYQFTEELELAEPVEKFEAKEDYSSEDLNLLQQFESEQSSPQDYQSETEDEAKTDWAIHETDISFAPTAEETEVPNAEFDAEKFEDFNLETVEESEISEHQPTQFFEKPAAAEPNLEEAAAQNVNSFESIPEESAPEESAPEEFAPIEVSPVPVEECSFFSNETVESNFQESGYADTFQETPENNDSAETSEVNLSPVAEQTYEEPVAETQEFAAHVQPEGFVCPFCNIENDAQAFTCSSCSAVLSLSDLEMLLANQNADREVIQQTVNRMEFEKTERGFEEYELMFLGIGHINLKNLRQGFAYLQQASQLNQNNVLLASQVNALAIRIDEIERQEEAHEAMPKGRTILVVDDSPTVRKLITGKLEKSGHEVFCAVDGMDALAKLDELVPDLILLDITMPRMDGYQVCKMIRNNAVTKDIPVVMISGKDGFFDKVRGRMAGTTGYITKPFGPETLMKALDIYMKPNFEQNLDHSITPDAL